MKKSDSPHETFRIRMRRASNPERKTSKYSEDFYNKISMALFRVPRRDISSKNLHKIEKILRGYAAMLKANGEQLTELSFNFESFNSFVENGGILGKKWREKQLERRRKKQHWIRLLAQKPSENCYKVRCVDCRSIITEPDCEVCSDCRQKRIAKDPPNIDIGKPKESQIRRCDCENCGNSVVYGEDRCYLHI